MKKTLTILAAAGALTAMAAPALAEVTPYASVRFGTFYHITDPQVGDKDADLTWDLAANSRFGVNATTGAIGGKVELGLRSTSAINATPTDVYTRLLYGTYKTSMGTLLVGHDYSNNWVTSAQTDYNDKGFSGYGALDNSRQSQIKFTMDNGVYLAAINPALALATYEVFIPELNVGYKGKAGAFAYNAGALFQTAKCITNAKQVTSFLGYFDGKFTSGPAALLFNIGYGQNTGDMAIASGLTGATNKYTAAGDLNVKTIEGFIQGSFTASDMVSVNLGLGYVSDDQDNAAKADARMALFVNAPITIAKGFTITPEIDYYDEMKNKTGAKQDKLYTVGAKWQMDF